MPASDDLPFRLHTVGLKTGIQENPEFDKKGLAQFTCEVGTKCGHGCTYCSSGAVMRRHTSFKAVDEDPFGLGYAIVDPDSAARISKSAATSRRRGLVQLCAKTDAWSPEAQRYDLGRSCLEGILAQTSWTVRVLSKNAAVGRDLEVIERHKERVLVGLSLTGTAAQEAVLRTIEPFASPITDRLALMRLARARGLRTYAMLCPILPGVAADPRSVDELVEFAASIAAEEVFVEPVNGRGPGLRLTVEALRAAGHAAVADAVDQVRSQRHWSPYVRDLLEAVQDSLRRRGLLDRLRFLLYPGSLLPADAAWIQGHMEGVKWLAKG